MAYSVARTDNLMGTDVRSALVSVKYIKNNAPTAIENGHVLKVGDLLDSEREIFAGVDVAANDKLAEVVLVVGPELLYNELKRRLDDYINVAGEPARAYRLHNGDTFSVTKDALAGAAEPAVGDVVELAAGTKLNVAAKATGATEGSTVVGRIIHIEDTGTYVYYTVLVVEGGEATEVVDSLPAVTSDDDGDVLTVVDGAWTNAAPSGGPSAITILSMSDFSIPTDGSYSTTEVWIGDASPASGGIECAVYNGNFDDLGSPDNLKKLLLAMTSENGGYSNEGTTVEFVDVTASYETLPGNADSEAASNVYLILDSDSPAVFLVNSDLFSDGMIVFPSTATFTRGTKGGDN